MVSDFDIASAEYDAVFTFSNIGKAQRRMVFKYLNPILNQKEKLSILELNCGTGEDAIQFAKLGHNVLATDISEGMIKVANAKSQSKNLNFKIQDIKSIHTDSFKSKFDLIFSNFGGFNCLSQSEIKSFFETATHLLHPNGKIVLVIMPKHCLWEQAYFSLKGNFKNAKRRKTSESTIANVDGVNVETWYHNPEEIISITKLLFKIEKVKPIGLSIPPSYLENSFLSKQPLISVFKAIDNTITNSFWAKYADHYLIELTKK
ncbi:class I SAM-dependent methyltransferase [Winogradskyella litoriviva]|uniref:Class I SAM-dependent methyltransferase n=1 Tax=Winogradskyella litoriviva TaxID=1220182 RepID=A0ABX2E949_9FLAO|nr:class I SAM-dependent methyltransferase [Winogradskyella litoriviva]NRD24319.1 class I SAM-dependent methyltransferase [Winogradskyella litoriviva]